MDTQVHSTEQLFSLLKQGEKIRLNRELAPWETLRIRELMALLLYSAVSSITGMEPYAVVELSRASADLALAKLGLTVPSKPDFRELRTHLIKEIISIKTSIDDAFASVDRRLGTPEEYYNLPKGRRKMSHALARRLEFAKVKANIAGLKQRASKIQNVVDFTQL